MVSCTHMESLCLAVVLAPIDTILEGRCFCLSILERLAGMECMYSSGLLAMNIMEGYVAQYICLIVILVFVLESF